MKRARETQEIYAPLAHRLGIFKLKVELDDLSLRYLEPERFFNLVKQLNLKDSNRFEYIKNIVHDVDRHLKKNNVECSMRVGLSMFLVFIKRCLNKKNTFDEIYDLFAVRVVVKDIVGCYTVLGILHNIYSYARQI